MARTQPEMLIHSHQSGNNARAANNPRPEFKPCAWKLRARLCQFIYSPITKQSRRTHAWFSLDHSSGFNNPHYTDQLKTSHLKWKYDNGARIWRVSAKSGRSLGAATWSRGAAPSSDHFLIMGARMSGRLFRVRPPAACCAPAKRGNVTGVASVRRGWCLGLGNLDDWLFLGKKKRLIRTSHEKWS